MGLRIVFPAAGQYKSGSLDLRSLGRGPKRLGKTEDGADVVPFLASDAACWISGTSPVDGGSEL